MSEPRPPATPPPVPRPNDAATGEWSSVTAKDAARPDSPTLTASGLGPTAGTFGIPNPFGRYTIDKLLGRGGMGAVFLAHDTQLDRPVAIKIPTFRGALSDTQKERFFREARAVAALRHPNICPVLDVDEEQGRLYLTMAFIDGQTLAALLHDGPLAAERAVRLLRRVARAMQAAHDHGTIHRDLKPANIMIDGNGSPVIMDFGLARKGDADDEPASESTTATVADAGLTQMGSVLGTPAYMPPEQAAGDLSAISFRSDVYSLGAVLYECLTGQRPFDGPDTPSVIKKILNTPPRRLRDHDNRIAPELEAVCLKALAKRPEDRYQSMDEFAAALQDAAELKLEVITPPPLPSEKRVLADRKKKRWISPLGCFALVAFSMLTCIGGSTIAVWILIDRVTDKVKEFQQVAERSNAEWEAISSFWQPPPENAPDDVLFPASLPNGFRRTSVDRSVEDAELGITKPGRRGVYTGPDGETIEVRAIVCPEAEAQTIQKQVDVFVKAVQQGRMDNAGSKRKKVIYTANNPGFRTVTFGFSDAMSQNLEYGKVWYGKGWLFYFKTSANTLIESFPSGYLMEVGKRAQAAPKEAKKKP